MKWLATNNCKLKSINKLAENIEEYLIEWVLTNEQDCLTFVSKLPNVLKKCDEKIYEEALVAEAYAYLHLLPRYSRFWDILCELTKYRVLPMNENGISILDIGTGPAPALYATYDFYKFLFNYATVFEANHLLMPDPVLDSVESSQNMIHLFHILSEIGNRSGPFSSTFSDFKGLSLKGARLRRRFQHILSIEEELDTSQDHARWIADEEDPRWQEAYKYNLCIFSNFLGSGAKRSEEVE